MPRIKKYRQSRYKAYHRPINKTLLIGIIAAAVILTLSIALGSYLGKISAPDTDTGDTEPSAPPIMVYDAYPKLSVAPVSSHPLPEQAYEGDSEAERAILRANGAMIKAMSMQLLDSAGAPRYKSEVYSRVYSAEARGMDLSLFMQSLNKNGISLTAIFPMVSMREENADIKAARRSFEISIIAEAYSCGLRDIMLTEAGLDGASELYTLMQTVKGLCPELAVGILIDADKAADTLLCAELDDIFDYLAIDHTDAFALDVSEYIPNKERAADSGTQTGQDSSPPESELYKSIYATLLVSERFGARAYVDIGDGCEYCTQAALESLSKARIESFVLDLSEAKHKTN